MNEKNSKVDFTFGWLAMKLLGKSLYSNAWSAISELVANGFDANAEEVYVFIDIRNKHKSVIEIFDSGTGMTNEEITTYVKVGYNKRSNKEVKKRNPMGRKGIGKLAALYLSEEYFILTKTEKEPLQKWQMSYVENIEEIDTTPSLKFVNDDIPLTCSEQWNKFETGTFLKLTQVNLSGKGIVAFEALAQKLSNYFSLNTVNKKIKLCVYNGEENIIFKDVEKSIAFGNMAFIEYSNSGKMSLEKEYTRLLTKSLEIPFTKKVTGGKNYKHEIEMSNFTEDDKLPIQGVHTFEVENTHIQNEYEYKNTDRKTKKIQYNLEGWIGIHSSVDKAVAKNNDSNFEKSNGYNPNQLRLYVRNKLAIENFLNVIDNNQAFVNYIEGELSFDILDDDNLPDIATSNRQSMDEHDDRIQLLKNLVEPIIQDLIKKRNTLANKIKESQKESQDKRDTAAKKQFTQELEAELNCLGDKVTSEEKVELTKTISNKLKGDIIKDEYVVFLSHAHANAKFTSFLYQLLLKCGARESEFFYTSKDGKKEDYENKKSLSHQVKESITKDNTLLFFLTSKEYKKSEFCMFEGGAGWATKAVGEFIMWSLNYEDIPKFLTDGKIEHVVEESLTKDNYTYIVITLNRIIEHINTGRKIRDEDLIELFNETTFPDQVELDKEQKTIENYMDKAIKEYWKSYVNRD
ncbi:MAG TPA: hypothetical protein EYG93_04230 [Sulfurospirillum arcachonense]|nr:hypothetical protein [Sulfurospirillum arcachonense]